jgi:hypothetical protein
MPLEPAERLWPDKNDAVTPTQRFPAGIWRLVLDRKHGDHGLAGRLEHVGVVENLAEPEAELLSKVRLREALDLGDEADSFDVP